MKRESRSDKLFIVFNYGFVIALTAVILYPLIFVVSASISDPAYVNTGRMWLWPRGVTLEGYERVFRNPEIWLGYRNTIFYTLTGVLINLFFTLPGAYALSRRDLVGRNLLTFIIVFTMFFQGGLIPSYLLVKSLGMVNTVWALLLPWAAGVFQIIVARTFFQTSVPRELEEAAEIDGCSTFRLFLSVVLPLSKPIIAVLALFYGVMHWNQYFAALVYLSDRNLYPLQLFLREILVLNQMSAIMTDVENLQAQLAMQRAADLVKYAVMIVAALPLLIVYPFLQRFFIRGMLIGSIKG
jgi:ABC-type sugar transport system, permease component